MSKSGGRGGGGRGRSKSHGHGGGGGGGGRGGGGGGQKKSAGTGRDGRDKVDHQQRSLRRQMHSVAAQVAAAAADDEISDNERDREATTNGTAIGKGEYEEEPNLTEELHGAIFSAFNQYLLDQELNKFNSLTLGPGAETLARRFQIVRPMSALLDVLAHPHGSVKLNQGDTCVVVAFYGPSDTRISKELPHRAVVDVIYRPKVTGASQLQVQQHEKDVTMQEERTIESIITGIFETVLYLDEEPAGTGFNVILQEYENDGCLLSACLNATNIAILDGCASMRNTVASVTAVVTNPPASLGSQSAQPQLIIDPNADQLKKGFSSQFIFAFTNDGKLLYSKVIGRLVTRKLYKWVMDQCLKAAQEIFAYYEFILKRKRGLVLDEDDDTPLLQGRPGVDPEMEVISSDEDELLVKEVEMVEVQAAAAPEPEPEPEVKRGRGRGRTKRVALSPTPTPVTPGRGPGRKKLPAPTAPVPVIDVEDLSSGDESKKNRELEDGEID